MLRCVVRIAFQKTIWLSEDLEVAGVFGVASSSNAAKQMKALAPSAARCRGMLAELHRHLQLPAESFAAVLGAPKATLRKWLSGERQPSGAAKRLIWLLHSARFDPSILRKLDGWLMWGGSPKEALERIVEDRTSAVAADTPPAKELSRNGPSVQTRKSLATFGELLDGDIYHIGIAMIVAAADSVRRSLNECEESIGRCDLDLKTKLRILDLKSAFVAQEMSLAETMLDWKRGRFPPTDDNSRRQPSFAPHEQVYPATSE